MLGFHMEVHGLSLKIAQTLCYSMWTSMEYVGHSYRVLQNSLQFQFQNPVFGYVWLWLIVTNVTLCNVFNMAPPVSFKLPKLIVVWRYELHMSISDIVHLSSCCERTVHYILK